MSQAVFAPVLVVLVAVELAVFGFGVQRLRTANSLRGESPMSIAEAKNREGESVEVMGTTEVLESTTQGKYSDKECLAYSWQRSKKGGSNSGVKGHGTEGVPFLVRDESGAIAVDPAGAQISGEKETFSESNHRNTEWRIEPDDEIHVYGRVQSLVEGRDGFGTERKFIGSVETDRGIFERIRARPLAAFGILIGLSRDLYITKGDESEAVQKVATIGLIFTIAGIGGLIFIAILGFIWFG